MRPSNMPLSLLSAHLLAMRASTQHKDRPRHGFKPHRGCGGQSKAAVTWARHCAHELYGGRACTGMKVPSCSM